MLKKTLTALLIAFATSSAPASAQEDFLRVPQGSTVITADGDTLLVFTDSWLASDSALVRVDRALRQARADASFHENNYNLRSAQYDKAVAISDSLASSLAASEAWRAVATKELERLDVSLVEKALWGLGGYLLGRAYTGG